jgi:hypothetical protein
MAATTLTEGSAPGRPSSRRTYVMTDRPGAVISFVASPAASRRGAKGGTPGSTSRRCNGSMPNTAASRGTKRGRGRSSPVSHTRMRDGLESSSAVASSSLVSSRASRAACKRSPRSSGRATQPPITHSVNTRPVAPNCSGLLPTPRAVAGGTRLCGRRALLQERNWRSASTVTDGPVRWRPRWTSTRPPGHL